MKIIFTFWLAVLIICGAHAQTKSPETFLGYELGSRFTPHHRLQAYFAHVAETSDRVSMQYYGESIENRPLWVVFVSEKSNLQHLTQIQQDNLRRAGIEDGQPSTSIPVVWLSYNVHGNEAAASEAAMMTLHELVNGESAEWLSNTMVVIDPCLNPDGRERYVGWYLQKANSILQPDPQSIEHAEPWPSGRPNHYLFDLNRDWLWQIQQESQQRMALYNRWMPQLHVDFHEMGIDDPFYFAPAAEPLHEQITSFQKKFQEWFGRNTARKFDENGWLYYTKEDFDLLYPSYGDTYPMYTGAIGMTIEQGGSGRAGLGMLNALGDTVTLRERIIHHHITALSAVETSSVHAEDLMTNYQRFFAETRSQPLSGYKTFVVRGSTRKEKLPHLLALLDKNGISYGQGTNGSDLLGYNYAKGVEERFLLSADDIVIPVDQPKSVLVQVLFEPEPLLTDSVTYDITAWALPFAFNLDAYALKSNLEVKPLRSPDPFEPIRLESDVAAYIAPWESIHHAKFLSRIANEGFRVRHTTYSFSVDGQTYPVGSLLITKADNARKDDWRNKITSLANDFQIPLAVASTGYVDAGKDFGSAHVKAIAKPKVALLAGAGTNSLQVGEIWHFFEEELEYPISVLEKSSLQNFDLRRYDVIILPSGTCGNVEDTATASLVEWVKSGGKLIAVENALDIFADQEGFELKTYRSDEEKEALTKSKIDAEERALTSPFQDRERNSISASSIGAVLLGTLDISHPLTFGIGEKYYTLKNNAKRYAYLGPSGVNAGIILSADAHKAGFIGYQAKDQLEKSLLIGVEPVGKGRIIYFVDNPLFRGFWQDGKLIMANAVFLPF